MDDLEKLVVIFGVVLLILFAAIGFFHYATAAGVDIGRIEVFTGEAVCEYVGNQVFCANKGGE